MSPRKGQESGQTTNDEHKRIEQAGSDAEAGRQAYDPEGGGGHIGAECPAREALVESLSSGWGESTRALPATGFWRISNFISGLVPDKITFQPMVLARRFRDKR